MNIGEMTPYQSRSRPRINFYRMRVEDFRSKNRYETPHENMTMFTQLVNGFKGRLHFFRITSKYPMTVSFVGEAASDCGGPMRDVISNVCDDLMSPMVPLLIPTANNLAKVEPNTDCYKLNP